MGVEQWEPTEKASQIYWRSLCCHRGIYTCTTQTSHDMHMVIKSFVLLLLTNYLGAIALLFKMVAAVWLGRNIATVMGSNSDPTQIDNILRRQNQTTYQMSGPAGYVHKHMGEVDRGDQMITNANLKSRKFYCIFFVDVAISNAFILFKNEAHQKKTLKEFQIHLELVEKETRETFFLCNKLCPLPLQHFPIHLPADNPAKHRREQCAHCTATLKKRCDSVVLPRMCSLAVPHWWRQRLLPAITQEAY